MRNSELSSCILSLSFNETSENSTFPLIAYTIITKWNDHIKTVFIRGHQTSSVLPINIGESLKYVHKCLERRNLWWNMSILSSSTHNSFVFKLARCMKSPAGPVLGILAWQMTNFLFWVWNTTSLCNMAFEYPIGWLVSFDSLQTSSTNLASSNFNISGANLFLFTRRRFLVFSRTSQSGSRKHDPFLYSFWYEFANDLYTSILMAVSGLEYSTFSLLMSNWIALSVSLPLRTYVRSPIQPVDSEGFNKPLRQSSRLHFYGNILRYSGLFGHYIFPPKLFIYLVALVHIVLSYHM